MSKPSPLGGVSRARIRRGSAFAVLSLTLALVISGAPAAVAAVVYPPNYNPLLIISEYNWRDSTSMSQADIQAFLDKQSGVLKSYSCPESGPNRDSTVVKPAAQIIAEAAQYYHVNPKLIIATLEKEQSLISQPWHTGKDIDPTSTHTYSTEYHLMYAMGAGVYPNSPDKHPGFGEQVYFGTRLLGFTTGSYTWWPGKAKTVYSYEHSAQISIVPLNQPTWNFYTYTPYYPQISVWKCYNKFFGDPVIDLVAGNVHRFYNKSGQTHFYTASSSEAQTIAGTMTDTFTYEGPAYSLDTTSGVNATPLVRFYNKRNGSHFYTASAAEAEKVKATLGAVYTYEGPAYNVSLGPTGCTTVYRFYNKRNGSHFYTTSEAERQNVQATLGYIYNFEGVAFYVGQKK